MSQTTFLLNSHIVLICKMQQAYSWCACGLQFLHLAAINCSQDHSQYSMTSVLRMYFIITAQIAQVVQSVE